jgi:hypothetical protein
MNDTTVPENSPKFLAQAKWRDGNPQKVWAQRALRSALKVGLITQMPCKVCGDPDSEAHHGDYSKPMDVDWLCRLHHKAEHRRLKCEEGHQ